RIAARVAAAGAAGAAGGKEGDADGGPASGDRSEPHRSPGQALRQPWAEPLVGADRADAGEPVAGPAAAGAVDAGGVRAGVVDGVDGLVDPDRDAVLPRARAEEHAAAIAQVRAGGDGVAAGRRAGIVGAGAGAAGVAV